MILSTISFVLFLLLHSLLHYSLLVVFYVIYIFRYYLPGFLKVRIFGKLVYLQNVLHIGASLAGGFPAFDTNTLSFGVTSVEISIKRNND